MEEAVVGSGFSAVVNVGTVDDEAAAAVGNGRLIVMRIVQRMTTTTDVISFIAHGVW